MIATWKRKVNGKDVTYSTWDFSDMNFEEVRIIEKALKLYLDYNPRKVKEKPSYVSKQMAIHMIDAIRNYVIKDISESEGNDG